MRTGVDGAGGLRGELRSGPVRIAIPHAPRDRCIRPREFLEDRQRIGRREVKAPVCRWKEDAKETIARQVARKIVR